MRYMMLVCVEDGFTMPEDERPSAMADLDAWVAEMDGRGVRREGSPLESPSKAKTVRVRNDELLVVDGPFVETKEVIAGYDLLECADLDEAIEVASKHPMARYGVLEIRPFWQE